jgi:hypothetical protein
VTTAFEADRRRRGPRDREPLVTDVQRFGLLSAAGVVSRYAAIVDRALGTGSWPTAAPPRARGGAGAGTGTNAGTGAGPDWLIGGGPRVAEAALRLLDQMTALAVEATTGAQAPERLVLPAATPGATSQASVWLHNPTAAPVSARVHVTTLVSGDGAVLPVGAVTCEPSGHGQLAPAGAHEVLLRVSVPGRQPPGHYHGLLVASVAPEPMPLELQVISGEAEAP